MEVCLETEMSQIETFQINRETTMETATFFAHAANDFGTARQALVRSTVGVALGYLNALGFDDADQNKVQGEVFKSAAKQVFRDAGNDRKTADRHVNTAITLSSKILTQIDLSSRHTSTERRLIDEVTENVWARGGKSIAAMKRLLDTGSAEEAPEVIEEKVDPAAGIAALIEASTGVDLNAPEPVVSQIETPATEADPVPYAFLADMDDSKLVELAKAVQAEMASRKRSAKKAA